VPDPELPDGQGCPPATLFSAGRQRPPADVRVTPGDLGGLPPLLIQAGSHELLLDDATRLAAKAAADDVAVILDITPGVPHVFQAFAAILDEGDAALNRVARFVQDNTARLITA